MSFIDNDLLKLSKQRNHRNPRSNFPSKLKVSHAKISLQLIIKQLLNHKEQKETVSVSMVMTQ